jgi:hypothetical protein
MIKASLTLVGILLSVNSAWAQCGGGNQLKSISPDQNGVTELQFSIDHFGKAETVTVDDNDGMATIAFLYFSLIQNVSDDLWQHKIQWNDIKDKKVAGWNFVGARILSSLNKVSGKFLEQQKEINAVIPKLQSTPTYSQLSDSLGGMLSDLAGQHGYDVQVDSEKKREYALVENNSNNPVGSLLITHPFTLPPELMAKCGGPLNVDLSNVLSK